MPPHGARFLDPNDLPDKLDLLMILDGNGTLLHNTTLITDRDVPILGINLKHLGFLTSCAPNNTKLTIERTLAGELPLEERLRLHCDVVRGSGERETRYAYNNTIINQSTLTQLIELKAYLDDQLITHYHTDNLIMTTPTDSTAYTLAAGGPIVTPEVRAMIITPICPHTLTNQPIITPTTSHIMVRLGSPAEHIMLTINKQ